jgi:Flp pilus assembly pilin Flp
MNTMINKFFNDESGAVTVDWVVLTAAVVGLGVAVLVTVKGGAEKMATNISTELGDATIADLDQFSK